jgi:hypothetical protein
MLKLDALRERLQERVPVTALVSATRAQRAEMDDEERAFLVYCVKRLRQHREESVPQRIGACARGRDATGTTGTVQDAGTF